MTGLESLRRLAEGVRSAANHLPSIDLASKLAPRLSGTLRAFDDEAMADAKRRADYHNHSRLD